MRVTSAYLQRFKLYNGSYWVFTQYRTRLGTMCIIYGVNCLLCMFVYDFDPGWYPGWKPRIGTCEYAACFARGLEIYLKGYLFHIYSHTECVFVLSHPACVRTRPFPPPCPIPNFNLSWTLKGRDCHQVLYIVYMYPRGTEMLIEHLGPYWIH